jgi:hypothetical protein
MVRVMITVVAMDVDEAKAGVDRLVEEMGEGWDKIEREGNSIAESLQVEAVEDPKPAKKGGK